MATLKDIAEELNVSTALVSKVLNDRMGNTGVSDRTRRAIMAKAQELDYRPHPLAVALKAGKRGAIGVFLHPFGEPGAWRNGGSDRSTVKDPTEKPTTVSGGNRMRTMTIMAGLAVLSLAFRTQAADVKVWTSDGITDELPDMWRNQIFGQVKELKPVTLVGARNGTFSGKIIVESTDPIKGLKASVGELAGAVPPFDLRVIVHDRCRGTACSRHAASH